MFTVRGKHTIYTFKKSHELSNPLVIIENDAIDVLVFTLSLLAKVHEISRLPRSKALHES